MSVLKKLRESRNLDVEDLAGKINVSPKDIRKWEKAPKQISQQGLSSLAYYFGLSSEDLLDAIGGDSSKLTSSDYYILGNEDCEDGWWGHFGIRLKGQDRSKWFPITIGTADRLSSKLANISSRDDWVVVETLNNRVLVFRPTTVNRIWLLDEAADQPDDDWDIPWDGYSGKPGEFYKALENYYRESEGIGGGKDEGVSSLIERDIEAFTDVHDLGTNQVGRLVIETQIYNLDGSHFSHDVDESRLVEIINNIEFELPQLIFDLSNENFDLYIPADNISLIDMPKRRVEIAFKEYSQALEESDNES